MTKTNFGNYLVKDYGYWTMFIHPNQNLIGRVYLWNKKKDAVDLFQDVSPEENDELQGIVKEYLAAMGELFQPSLMNYSSLGNVTKHLHVHLVPRYDHSIEFEGRTFEDLRYGKNAIPYDKREISENIKLKIRDKLRDKLNYEMQQN